MPTKTISRAAATLAFAALVLVGTPAGALAAGTGPDAPVIRALERHAGLQAARARLRAAEARAAGFRAYRAPMLQVSVMQPPTLKGSQISLTQPLEASEKRDVASRLALADARRERAAIARLESGIRQEVRKLLAEQAYLEAAAALIRRAQARSRDVAQLSAARYAVGKASQADLLVPQVRQSELHHDQVMLEEQIATTRARLGALLESDPDKAPDLAPHGPPPRLDVSAENLVALALEHSPMVLAEEAMIARAQLEREQARLERESPDFEVGLVLGKGQVMGDPMVGAMVGVELPFLQPTRFEGMRRASEEELVAARKGVEQARLDVRSEIATLLARLAALESKIRLHREALAPQSELAFKAARTAYSAGMMPLADVLDRQQDLDEAERAGERLEADYRQALADLEAAVGVPLDWVPKGGAGPHHEKETGHEP